MPNPNYLKGRRCEWAIRLTLEGIGFAVIRAAASQGPYDLVGIHKERPELVLIQAKAGQRPSPCEYRAAMDLPLPAVGVIAMVVWYPPAASAARVLYCSIDPLPAWCGLVRWLPGPPPRQPKLRGL